MRHAINSFTRNVFLTRRLELIRERIRFYEQEIDPERVIERQITQFNRVWRRCYEDIPFYAFWQDKHRLPEQISSVEDLNDFPMLTKRDVIEHQALIMEHGKVRGVVHTGGSTGEPASFPVSAADHDRNYANMYTGRSWWGIEPLVREVKFWGHSHLFGTGLRGAIKERKRRAQDFLINTVRLNAYDTRLDTLARYAEKIRATQPISLVGYTSCLYKLARYLIDQGNDRTGFEDLKAVIPTAETVSPADVTLMEQAFGAPVAIEYGMAETGVIAHSQRTANNIRVFWDSFICTVGEHSGLTVTTLGDKRFPLIHYRTDDIVEPKVSEAGSLLAITAITGRKKDILKIGSRSGQPLHVNGVFFHHVLKLYPSLYSIQFEQVDEERIHIHLSSDRRLDLEDVRSFFLREVAKDHPDVDPSSVDFFQGEEAEKTLAGKEQLVR